jgi:hypothetical protein
MSWQLTPERRDAVVFHLLSNALHALEDEFEGDRRRAARLWIERATEVLRQTSSLAPSSLHKERLVALKSLLDKIAAQLQERGPAITRH